MAPVSRNPKGPRIQLLVLFPLWQPIFPRKSQLWLTLGCQWDRSSANWGLDSVIDTRNDVWSWKFTLAFSSCLYSPVSTARNRKKFRKRQLTMAQREREKKRLRWVGRENDQNSEREKRALSPGKRSALPFMIISKFFNIFLSTFTLPNIIVLRIAFALSSATRTQDLTIWSA